MAELVRVAGPFAEAGWIYGFTLNTNGDDFDVRAAQMMAWCNEQFGPHSRWDAYRRHTDAPKAWSRYGFVFLFADEDMAFEFRMRWT